MVSLHPEVPQKLSNTDYNTEYLTPDSPGDRITLMRITHKGQDGLTNHYCLKCGIVVGALGNSTAWCKNGHRMSTKKELDAAEQRRIEREAKKGNNNG